MGNNVKAQSNRLAFGLGTIGRDMVYSLISMYLIYFLTDVVNIPTADLWWITIIMLIARVYDACNDPVMGIIVDNTRTRFGKFKPWIAIGAALSALFTVLMFVDFGVSGAGYVSLFAVIYLMWGMSFTANDIAYWSMLPALSVDQKEREKIGSFARICANAGLFFVVAGIVPITESWALRLGGLRQAYTAFAVMVSLIMALGQMITLIGVKQPKLEKKDAPVTPLRELIRVIVKNDQLSVTAISMVLFMVGYVTTTSFGLYYFEYIYGDKAMYPIFAVILGVSQIAALAVFPLFSRRFSRRTLYTSAIIMVCAGYVVFFIAPATTMLYIGIAGMLLFVGQAFIQLLMLMFLADSVDYGHWKLGKRNDSVTFSLQPFINKMGGAMASGIVGVTVILSGMKDASGPADMGAGGIFMVKAAMMIFPLVCIVISYAIYRAKYKIDKETYDGILADLRARGEIAD